LSARSDGGERGFTLEELVVAIVAVFPNLGQVAGEHRVHFGGGSQARPRGRLGGDHAGTHATEEADHPSIAHR
jgi:hypothetical protein